MSHISGIVYSLRQQYGSSVRYLEILSSDTDRVSGSRSIVKKAHDLDIVHLPASMLRKFIQDIGYLAANKNFTYGGLNDYDEVGFLLMNVPFNPDLNGYIVWNNARYEKSNIESFNNGEVYLLKVRRTEGGPPFDVVPVYASSVLQMQGVATYELN